MTARDLISVFCTFEIFSLASVAIVPQSLATFCAGRSDLRRASLDIAPSFLISPASDLCSNTICSAYGMVEESLSGILRRRCGSAGGEGGQITTKGFPFWSVGISYVISHSSLSSSYLKPRHYVDKQNYNTSYVSNSTSAVAVEIIAAATTIVEVRVVVVVVVIVVVVILILVVLVVVVAVVVV